MRTSTLLVLFLFALPVSAAESIAEKFAVENVVTSVSVSPNGEYLALIKNQPRSGETVLEVYKSDALNEKPFRMSHDPMRILDLAWVSEDTLFLGLLQQNPEPSIGLSVVDVKRESVTLIPEANPTVVGYWPTSHFRIVLSFPKLAKDDDQDMGPMPSPNGIFSLGREMSGVTLTSRTNSIGKLILGQEFQSVNNIGDRFIPRDYFDLNLRTNKKRRLIRTDSEVGQVEVDGDGKPWLGRGLDVERSDYVWYVPTGEKEGWREIFRLDVDSPDTFRVEGFDVENRNILFVAASNDNDTVGIWEFAADRAEFGELIYRRPDVDVAGVRYHSNSWANPDLATGIVYYTDQEHVEYFDSGEAALYKQFGGLIPEAHHISISSRSRDGATLTVNNVGPKDPGSNYLLRRGKLHLLGGSNPLLGADDLSQTEYVDFKTADGRNAHAYVTASNNDKPLPTVVLLRQEPSVRQVVDYDALTQALAHSGYRVVQPLLGDTNQAADTVASINHFVEKGLADSGRTALLGWGEETATALQVAASSGKEFQCVFAAVGPKAMESPQHGGYLEALDQQGKKYQIKSVGVPDPSTAVNLFELSADLYLSMTRFFADECEGF